MRGDEAVTTKQVEAVYENGVLRPLEPLPLDEHQRVTLTVYDAEDSLASMIDHAFVERVRKEFRTNKSRPHRALGERTPNEFAFQIAASCNLKGLETFQNSP